MINKSLIAALIFVLPFASNAVSAADVKILCASGMREIVSELQPHLERVTGQHVSISFGEAGDLRKRMQGCEIANVAILPRIVLDQVAADGNVVAGTIIDISQSSIGIGVRKDGPKPDISFRQALLAAKAIVVTDPTSSTASEAALASLSRGRPRNTKVKNLCNSGLAYTTSVSERASAPMLMRSMRCCWR